MVYQKTSKKLALLLNPEGGRNQREWSWVLALAQQMGLEVCLASRPKEIEESVYHLVSQKKDILVSGGDGTVSLVLTALKGLPSYKRPLLGLLPGGTTNLIARDLSPLSQIQILHALKKKPAKLQKRLFLELEPPGRCGMFVGGGLILEGVKYFRQKRSLAQGKPPLLGRVILALSQKIFRARSDSPVKAMENGLVFYQGPFWVFWATSLLRLFGRFSPGLSCPHEELRVNALLKGKMGLFPLITKMLLGKTLTHQPQEGIYSLCSRKLVIYARELALDGEIYTSPQGKFILSAAGEVIFITW